MAQSEEPLERAEKVERSPSLQCSNCIAAIDFGTSSVSLAYTTPLNKGDIQVHKFDKHDRVPNAILIKITLSSGQCQVLSIGHQAQTAYSKLKKESEQQMQKHIYFERIKMLLEEDKNINHATIIPSFTGGEYYLIEVIAFIIKYLKDVLLFKCSDQQYKCSDFDWVITVPAIWKARARRMMREAAYLAGLTCDNGGITMFTDIKNSPPQPKEVNPHKLALALEPEAAAIYIYDYLKISQLPAPLRYMVVDIGGGTVDITVHDRKDGKINAIIPPIGNTWGGTTVNQALRDMIEDLVQDKEHAGYCENVDTANAALNKLYYNEFEEEKKNFGDNFKHTSSSTDEAVITLPRSFVNYYTREKIARGARRLGIHFDDNEDQLRIQYGFLESRVFKDTVDGIIKCVKEAIQQMFDKVVWLFDNIDTIYLVGGFGSCRYIQLSLEKGLEEEKGKGFDHIICPQRADLAVTIGAVMWRQAPDIIQSRIADATYGLRVTQKFDPSRHDEYYRYIDKNGKKRCDNILLLIVEKGEATDKNSYKTCVFPVYDDQKEVNVGIYSKLEGVCRYTKDKNGKPTMQKIGQLIVKTPIVGNNTTGKRHIDITIDFSSTEIQASAIYRINGEKAQVVCDFLSYQEES